MDGGSHAALLGDLDTDVTLDALELTTFARLDELGLRSARDPRDH
jgi:hypothetical protein